MQVCTSLQTDNHASTPPLSCLHAGCPSCHPTNSVKALKATEVIWNWKDTTQCFAECAAGACDPRHRPYTAQICWTCARSATIETERSIGNSDDRRSCLPTDSGDRTPAKTTQHNSIYYTMLTRLTRNALSGGRGLRLLWIRQGSGTVLAVAPSADSGSALQHSNLRFESIRFVMRIDSFCNLAIKINILYLIYWHVWHILLQLQCIFFNFCWQLFMP